MNLDFDVLSLLPTREKLIAHLHAHTLSYRSAEPFPHVVIDDFLPEAVAESLLKAFPDPQWPYWIEYRPHRPYSPRKTEMSREQFVPPAIRNLFFALNSQVFTTFLAKMTNIQPLIGDPMLHGSGMHQIENGSSLAVHLDGNKHRFLPIHRRLNLLLYLNKEWNDAYGGNLELWDKEAKGRVREISPTFNRCVIMETSERSYHGHPRPLTVPPGVTRKSLALYYWSSEKPPKDLQSRGEPHWVHKAVPALS